MKININKQSNKTYRHDYRVTNSTTNNFSFVQPVFCRMMMPQSKIKGSMGSFVRLAPMPFPTFGDIRLKNVARYIPIEDIFPAFASFISRKNYMQNLMDSIPYVPNSQLVAFLLQSSSTFKFCSATTYTIPVGGPAMHSSEAPFHDVSLMPFDEYRMRFRDKILSGNECTIDYYDDSDNLVQTVNHTNLYANELVLAVENKTMTEQEAISAYAASTPADVLAAAESSDFVFVNYSGSFTTSNIVCYKLTSQGRALRKIFLGLGYNLSRDDNTNVSVLPLFAFYKAWFDEFYPSRGHLDWSDTACYKIIHMLSDKGVSNIVADASAGEVYSSFLNFINTELANCWVTSDADFLSMHSSTLYDASLMDDGIGDINTQPPSDVSVVKPVVNPLTGASSSFTPNSYPAISSSSNVTAVGIKLLLKLNGYFSKDSVIGQRINTWMQSHIGSDVLERYASNSNRVADCSIPIEINDVDSLANTAALGSDPSFGSVLGAYSGKGIGNGKLTFSWESKTFGYFIILQCVRAVTGYYQGTDTQLFALTPYQLPRADFDCLGYEITPRSAVWTDNGISLRGDIKFNPSSGSSANNNDYVINGNRGFGYVPRYSGFKVAKNIVNGDLNLGSTKSSFAPYYLDREFKCRRLVSTGVSSGSSAAYLSVDASLLPRATTEWQYQQRHGYIGNYDRIFYNSSSPNEPYLPYLSAINTYFADDNFIVHNLTDFTEFNVLKPLSQSWQTEVSNSDNSMTTTI